MPSKSIKKAALTLSIAAALGCGWSSNLMADGSDVEALEARVAELEALVQQLLSAQQAGQPQVSEDQMEARAEAIAEEKVNEALAQHQAAIAEKEHKHNFKFGGYIKTDVIFSDYGGGSVASGSIGRDFYLASTVPVGEQGERYVDMHAKETRINFKSTHLLDNGKSIGTYVEMDFLGSAQGDERVSNSYSPRLRHAFVTYGNWLFGQTWNTFFNVAALPENLDFIGPAESTVFGRQAMIRHTNGPWQFSIENPETTITPNGGGSRIKADDSLVPEFVARFNMKNGITIAGTLRQLALDDKNLGVDDSTLGYGISISGKHMIGEKDDFRWMATTGKGLGRHLGLNTVNGAVITDNNTLETIDSSGVFGSFRHFWSEQWRSNFTLGYLSVDNPTEYTGMGVTKKASSAHINLIYTPVPRLDVGVEFMYADREVESGTDGDLKRLQFSAKYAY